MLGVYGIAILMKQRDGVDKIGAFAVVVEIDVSRRHNFCYIIELVRFAALERLRRLSFEIGIEQNMDVCTSINRLTKVRDRAAMRVRCCRYILCS